MFFSIAQYFDGGDPMTHMISIMKITMPKKPISGSKTGPGKSEVLAYLVRGKAPRHSLTSLRNTSHQGRNVLGRFGPFQALS